MLGRAHDLARERGLQVAFGSERLGHLVREIAVGVSPRCAAAAACGVVVVEISRFPDPRRLVTASVVFFPGKRCTLDEWIAGEMGESDLHRGWDHVLKPERIQGQFSF